MLRRRAAPGISTQTSASSISSGSVTDTATLTQTGQLGAVAGTVTFFVCGPATSAPNCATGGTQVGSAVTVSGGSATSASFTPVTAGTYCFRAVFAPGAGSNYLTTSHTNQTFGTNGECFVLKAVPGVSTQASSGSVTLGTPVTDTATFTQTGQLGAVNGTVDFYVCGPSVGAPNCATGGTLVTDDAPVSGGAATSSGFTPLAVGTYCFRADFTPAVGSNYLATSHTNQSTGTNGECFTAAGTPNIDVEKDISIDGGGNWLDADVAPGPTTAVGGAVKIRFTVTNSGTVPLSNITLTDSDFSTASCTVPASLAVGASFSCIIDVTLGVGVHIDTATATGQFVLVTVSDTDDVHAFRPAPSIDVEKEISVDGGSSFVDADAAPGPTTAVNGSVQIRFTVRNTGNVALTGVTLTDTDFSTASCTVPASLAANDGLAGGADEFTCTITVTVSAGAHVDTASASGVYAAVTYTDTDDAHAFRPAPALSLDKSSVDTTYAAVGDVLDYSFLVTNTGNVTLAGPITVSDDKATNESCPAVPVGGLVPGGSITCTASYTVTQADLDAGEVTNAAFATTTYAAATVTSNTDTLTIDATQSPALSLVKSASPSTYDSVNDVISYSYLLTNTGNVTLSGPFSISDDQAADEACPPTASLAPNASITCSASDTVTQADLDAGSITNTAGGTGFFGLVPVLSNTDSETVTAVQTPALSLDKSSVDTTYAAVGDVLDYSFLVTNTGNVTLAGPITVSDDKATNESCPAVPVGGLVPGGSITCTASYTVTQADLDAGEVTNAAFATTTYAAATVTSNTDTLTIDATQSPALSLVKSASPSTYDSVNDVISYSYLLTNTGNVTLSGPFSISDDQAADEACPPTASLAPNASITCSASDTVTQADLDAGSITNTAGGTGFFGLVPVLSNTDSETVTAVQTVTISIAKAGTLDLGGNGVANPGDLISYTFELENTGNVTLDGVVVTDPSVTVTCPLAASVLDPGETATCTASYAISQADINAGQVANTADVDATGPQDQPASDTDSAIVPVPQVRTISIDKEGVLDIAATAPAGRANPGDTIAYTFDLENTGNVTLTGVSVSDPSVTVTCPAAASILDPGETATCTATYVIDQADIDAGEVINTAAVSSTAPQGQAVTDTDTENVDVPQVITIDLAKAGVLDIASTAPAGRANPGDTIAYTFTITNTGNVTLDDVVLSDPDVAETCGAFDGSLAPGESVVCTASYAIDQADIDAGQVDNTATVDASGPQDQPATDTASEMVDVPQVVTISIAKAGTLDLGGNGVANPGDLISYTFELENTGNVTLDGVVVTDPSVTVTCPLGASVLDPGETATCTASYAISQADINAGQVANTADVDATGPQDQPASDTDSAIVPVPQVRTISIDKEGVLDIAATAPAGRANPGDTIAYTFDLENTGNVTLTGVSVSDPSVTVTCPAAASILDPGETATCTATYVIDQADIDAGEVINTAAVSSTAPQGQAVTDTDTENVDVPQVITIDLAKAGVLDIASTAPAGRANPGDTIAYTFTITNTGNVTLDDVVLSDPDVAETCGAFDGSLAPGESVVCTASYAIDQADIDAGQVDNTATVDASGPQDQPATDTASEMVDVPQVVTISIAKAGTLDLGGNGVANPGDLISYTFELENTGNVTLDGVVVTDPSVTVTCPLGASVLDPGETATCTASYAISQADINAGQVANTADVDATGPQDQPASDTDSAIVPVPQVRTISIDKEGVLDIAATAPAGRANPGDTIAYTFDLENTGNVTLTGVSVSDPSVTVTCPAAASILDPGETATCTATYVIDQADIDAGEVINTAAVSSTAPQGQAVTDTDTENVDVPQVRHRRSSRPAPSTTTTSHRPAGPTPATRSPTPSSSPTPATSP